MGRVQASLGIRICLEGRVRKASKEKRPRKPIAVKTEVKGQPAHCKKEEVLEKRKGGRPDRDRGQRTGGGTAEEVFGPGTIGGGQGVLDLCGGEKSETPQGLKKNERRRNPTG